MYITQDHLLKITQKKLSNNFVVSLNDVFLKYDISTNLRKCHFLAQVLHESGGLRWRSEIWGPTNQQLKYDTRIDLGNTPEIDDDGKLYRGRGFIQLTGKANYKKYSEYIGVDFVKNPDLVAELPYSLDVAGWFWNTRKLNTYADSDNIKYITKRINGGYNGLDDRINWLSKCKVVLIN